MEKSGARVRGVWRGYKPRAGVTESILRVVLRRILYSVDDLVVAPRLRRKRGGKGEVRGCFGMTSSPRGIGVSAGNQVAVGGGLQQEELEREEFDALLHPNVLDTLADL